MRLKKITTKDTSETISVRLRGSVLAKLSAYQDYYKATYGEEIKQSPLIEEMLRSFMEADKDFMKTTTAKV